MDPTSPGRVNSVLRQDRQIRHSRNSKSPRGLGLAEVPYKELGKQGKQTTTQRAGNVAVGPTAIDTRSGDTAMDPLHNPAFPVDEYRRRLARVQALMVCRGLAVLVLRHRADICYLSGMENAYLTAAYALLVPAAGEPTLLSSDFEMLNARVGVWCDDRVSFPVGGDVIGAVAEALRARGLAGGPIGVEIQSLPMAQYRALQMALPDTALVAADDLVPEIKVVKSAAEIAYLREAGRLSTLGMEAALAAAAPGRTDNDLAAAAHNLMVRGGSEFPCIEPIVSAGARAGVPHSTFRRTTLQPGDAVLVEVGACICRYTAPLFRTAALKPVPAGIRAAADACRDSLNALLEALRPGVVARDAATKARAAWTPLCDRLIWHGIYAYTVGLGFPPDWNDGPYCVTEQADFLLQPGMCFHATTSLREPGRYGAALSETVLITETGNEVLTGTRRELFVGSSDR
jgi:Xaa-Pro dipeptidase